MVGLLRELAAPIYVNSEGKTCPIKCTSRDIPIGTLKNIEKITGIKF